MTSQQDGEMNPGDMNPDDKNEIEAILQSLADDPPQAESVPVGLWDQIDAAIDADERAAADDSSDADDRSVVDLGQARGRRRPLWGQPTAIATLAAAVLVLIAVPIWLSQRSTDSVELAATLDPLGTFDGGGEAHIVDSQLEVDTTGLEPHDDAFYELWLLRLDGDELVDLVSLGRVDSDGRFTIPEGIDLDEFGVVDISLEPDDGDDAHSGDSVLRGPLSPEAS